MKSEVITAPDCLCVPLTAIVTMDANIGMDQGITVVIILHENEHQQQLARAAFATEMIPLIARERHHTDYEIST